MTDHFFRINNDTLEIFVTGLSLTFTKTTEKDTWNNRLRWITNEVAKHISKTPKVVLDCRMENFYMNYIGMHIVRQFNLLRNNTKLLTTVDPKGHFEDYEYEVDHLSQVNYCYYLDELVQRNIDWESIHIDRPILSLASRATETRAYFTKTILNLNYSQCRASFGISMHYPVSDREKEIYAEILKPYSYPLRHDTDNHSMVTLQEKHTMTGEKLFHSLLNVVHETNDHMHTDIHISEKTFKAFAWHQIPIFLATPEHANVVRELGFDLFDDIIDHNYTSIKIPHVHQMKVLSVISKFLKEYPDANALRKELFPRLKKNYNKLLDIRKFKVESDWPIYG